MLNFHEGQRCAVLPAVIGPLTHLGNSQAVSYGGSHLCVLELSLGQGGAPL